MNCNFKTNPAYAIGMTLLFISVFARNVLELEGLAGNMCCLLSGASCSLVLVGLLYGSPKTRPLFDRFRAFKRQLLGR